MMDLEETFANINVADVESMVSRGQEEHLQLEFKTVNDPGLNRDDRRQLATCLSGFANSSGGLIIWGILARKNSENVDCAVETKPISSLPLLISRLNNFTGEAISPTVDGVRHKALDLAQGCGYAVTIVPESQSTPHMAKLGEDRYYKRSGDGFYRMEHFDLEDMFGRRQKPALRLNATQKAVANQENVTLIELSILNVGRGVARHAGFCLEFEGAKIVGCHKLKNSSILNDRAVASFQEDISVFHPNGINNVIGSVTLRALENNSHVQIKGKIFCEGIRPEICNWEFPLPAPETPTLEDI